MGKRSLLNVAAVLALSLGAPTGSAQAATLGMVADNFTNKVTVFDADSDTVLGSVSIPFGAGTRAIGDCVITADQQFGFVTNFQFQVWVIDLTTNPPSLATGINPIPIANSGQDLALSADQRHLVVSDGANVQPICVIDVASRTMVSQLSLGISCCSVEVSDDGSVLAASFGTSLVYRLTLDGNGVLSNTGETAPAGGRPNNLVRAPGGRSGLVVTREANQVRSFTYPPLTEIDTRPLEHTFGISGITHPAGDRVFVRSQLGPFGPEGAVNVFTFDPDTGALGSAAQLTIQVSATQTHFGMDQLAFHPSGRKLYVTQPSAVNIYDADSGALLGSLTGPSIRTPTGIFVVGSAVNNAPTVSCPGAQTVEATSSTGADAELSVHVEDADGDALTVVWSVDGEVVQTDSVPGGGSATSADVVLAQRFALGSHTVEVAVSDGVADPVRCSTTVHVVDTTAPTVSASVALGSLWPANGKMNNVGLTASASDAVDAAPAIVVHVFSDEDDSASEPDAANLAPGTLELRADRDSKGDGRVFLVVVTATDSAGNVGVACVTVTVQRDESASSAASVAAQATAAREHYLANGQPPSGYAPIGE